ncbi:MAG: septum formation initiator family protein [Caldilineaceae bacterium]
MPTPKRDIRVLFTIVLALCLLFSATYASRLARKNQVDAEIARWEQKIEHSKERQYALENELRYIRSDAYIQKLAHDEFGMVQPGEQLVVVVPAEQMDATAAIVAPLPAPTMQTRWRQWLSWLGR